MPATARPGRLTVLPSGEQFEISSGAHRATIVEVGGGLREYEVDGRAVIEPYFADRMCDGAHGAPLIPWPNRLADGRYTFDGDEYQVPLTESEKRNAIHGFLLWRSWDAVEGDADRVVMSTRLYPLDGYPFTLDVRVDYQLGSEGLIVTTTVENVGDRDCPYGHGQHPGARRDRRLHGATGRPHPDLHRCRAPAAHGQRACARDGVRLPGAAAARGHTDRLRLHAAGPRPSSARASCGGESGMEAGYPALVRGGSAPGWHLQEEETVMASRLAARDHQVRVTTDHPVRLHTAAMERATTTGPLTVARLARALTYLVYGLAALVLRALIEWLTDRIAEMGYAR